MLQCIVIIMSIFDALSMHIGRGSAPRGGHRMVARAQIRQHRERTPVRKCRKAMGLITDWSASVCSAPRLWKRVEYAILDDRDEKVESHPLLQRLYKCVRSDKDQNCHKRLMKLFLDECGFKHYITPIDGANSSVTAVIKPTALFGLIHGGDRGTFYRVMGASKPILKKFWEDFFSTPDGAEYKLLHPILKDRTIECLYSTVPCSLHEDAGPYANGKSANSLTWKPMF